jgi:pre-mRNA-splicing helicase BRR2
LLGGLTEERFALLVNLGKKITDFGTEEKIQTTGKNSMTTAIHKHSYF